MTIIPPGNWMTVLPAGEVVDGDGDADGEGEPEADDDGDDEPDGELPGCGEPLEDGGDELAAAVVGGGVVATGGVEEYVGFVVDCVVAVWALVGVVAVTVWLAFGPSFVLAVALAEAAEAADADCSLACADTPACEMTRGLEPATSCPTRLTAVNVTAVTSAHDIAQPRANASGRPAQPRTTRAKDRGWRRWSGGGGTRGTGLVSASPSRD